jgi:ABC-type multidrug transport system fused ATPase/permease subunit
MNNIVKSWITKKSLTVTYIIRLNFAIQLFLIGVLITTCPIRIYRFFDDDSHAAELTFHSRTTILLTRLLGTTLISFAYQSGLTTLHFHSLNKERQKQQVTATGWEIFSSEVLFLMLVSIVGILEWTQQSSFIQTLGLRRVYIMIRSYASSKTCVDDKGFEFSSLHLISCGIFLLMVMMSSVVYTSNGSFFNLGKYTTLHRRSWIPSFSPINVIHWSHTSQMRRIIGLVHAQKYTFYTACCVSFLRWPLSLSIPHYASSTLGALGREDYSSAKRSILSLLIYGSIDACLEYWFVVLFGLTNLRIVKGLRLEAFSKILQQEMAYFDRVKSGDFVSRINADPQTVGSDLTWFLRTLYVFLE